MDDYTVSSSVVVESPRLRSMRFSCTISKLALKNMRKLPKIFDFLPPPYPLLTYLRAIFSFISIRARSSQPWSAKRYSSLVGRYSEGRILSIVSIRSIASIFSNRDSISSDCTVLCSMISRATLGRMSPRSMSDRKKVSSFFVAISSSMFAFSSSNTVCFSRRSLDSFCSRSRRISRCLVSSAHADRGRFVCFSLMVGG